MSSNTNSTPATTKAQRLKDAREADDAQNEPQTPATSPAAEHLGATEEEVVRTTALTDDEENAAADIDPADEITPG